MFVIQVSTPDIHSGRCIAAFHCSRMATNGSNVMESTSTVLANRW